MLTANVTTAHYEAGHMMYIRAPSHAALKADLAAFYHAAAGGPAEAPERPGRRKKRGKGWAMYRRRRCWVNQCSATSST